MSTNEENLENAEEVVEFPVDETPEELTVEQELEKALQEKEELLDRYARLQAETENFKRRTQKEVSENLKYSTANIVRSLLPAMDNLQRALVAAESSTSVEDLKAGVQMVAKQFEEALGNHSIKKIEALGEQFDPNLHEALQQVPTADHLPMSIMQELEPGYVLHERVIRPTKVIVAQAMPEVSE